MLSNDVEKLEFHTSEVGKYYNTTF